MANTTIPIELSSTPGIVDNSNATAITIDSSENVGIGVSPPSSATLFDYLFVNGIGVAGLGTEGGLYNNAYYDGSAYKRINTGYASRIYMASDSSLLYDQASTSSAGTDVTFSTALKIDSSGRVGIGTSSPSSKLLVSDTSGGNIAIFTNTTSADLAINCSSGVTLLTPSTGTLAFGTSNIERMRIDSSGNVLINCTSAPSASVAGIDLSDATGIRSAKSTTAFAYHARFYNPNGQVGYISTNGSATSFITSSDYRLKENVDYNFNALERVAQLKPARFNFIADADTTVDGFIAHEVQDIVPEAISGVKDAVDADGNPEYQGIDQSKLVPLLTKAIQEQQTIIESLEARITALES